jgi:putative methionine-R-sulfoxide reductase with GAF domain
MLRNYEAIVSRLVLPQSADRHTRMQAVVDALWDALAPTGVSWAGFYLHAGGDELILGPRRDKPACSPIGLHGACGRAFLTETPLLVQDVRELGAGYIACDPRDQSEVVIPCRSADGVCWGVLDLDSHDLAAFDESDVAGLSQVLAAAGLLTPWRLTRVLQADRIPPWRLTRVSQHGKIQASCWRRETAPRRRPAEVAKWQTRGIQNPVPARECGFKSHLRQFADCKAAATAAAGPSDRLRSPISVPALNTP